MPLLGDGVRFGPPEQIDQVRHDWHEPEPRHQARIIPPDQDRPHAVSDNVESLRPGPDPRMKAALFAVGCMPLLGRNRARP